MHPEYDTSEPALKNYATGNPHYDCMKFDAADVMFLCYLASDRDRESAEGALDRLRSLVHKDQVRLYLPNVYQTGMLVRLGNDNVTVSAAACDLLRELERSGYKPEPLMPAVAVDTGCTRLDALLTAVITELRIVFGDRLISCYAVGSAFDGSKVGSSDTDLHLLFSGTHSAMLKRAVQEFAAELGRKYGADLDLIPFFESDIKPWADVRTKLGGKQIYGDCPPDILVLPPMPDYVRENMHRAYFYMARARRFPDRLCYPVSAPDEADRFCGYNSRVHEDGSPSTKELVVVAGWLSTALVSRRGQRYIASKSASYAGYCQTINDEWTAHLKDVFELVRQTWNYRLPESDADLEILERICRKQVEFENHFLREYRQFLEEELVCGDPVDVDRAEKLLAELAFDGAPAPKKALLIPAWQLSTRRTELDPRLISVDHFVVKVDSLRNISDKTLRTVFQRWEEFGVVIFACKDTLDLKYDLLGLQGYFGNLVFHPRSDATGITSVRNMFKPEQGFAGTTRDRQTPHTDGSFRGRPPGIVALQAEICGLCGGESLLVFGDALHRYMRTEHPKELETLFREGAFTIGRGDESCSRPVYWHEEGRVHMAYRCGNGEHLEVASFARRGFNRVFDWVNEPKNQMRFRLPANNVLVVDNHRNLHGRTGWPADTVRCLNRLWLDGFGDHPCYPGIGLRVYR